MEETAKVTSTWIKNHIAIDKADVDALKKHGWQHTVFILPWGVLLNPHWCHE